jgi:hypothetical protein
MKGEFRNCNAVCGLSLCVLCWHQQIFLLTAACISLDHSPNTFFVPDETVPFLVVPSFRRVNIGWSLRSSGFDHGPVFVGYVVDGVTMRTGFLRVYTGCNRRNVRDFGTVFLMLKYTDITQNTYIQRWTVTEIMAREVWNFNSCYSLIDYQMHIETGRNMWFL